MTKKQKTLVFEIVKAILYALGGFFGIGALQ